VSVRVAAAETRPRIKGDWRSHSSALRWRILPKIGMPERCDNPVVAPPPFDLSPEVIRRVQLGRRARQTASGRREGVRLVT
jgi:hypothetical protein